MYCVHCGEPIARSWHMPQEDPLPELRVGSLAFFLPCDGAHQTNV